ncbi:MULTISPECIES: glycosyltransferase family 39 protein [unclassified Microbacterium]|uniref:glycosyltransferase family 39 protein n=1 Tax=unclassified Microbacterium TaxID=2609290 RepID=UPI003658F121
MSASGPVPAARDVARMQSPRRRHGSDAQSGVLTVVLCVATAALGTIAAFAVPAGLPYDEPAHWANAVWVAVHGTLPVLGDPGVTYEGQQAPVFYLVAAGIIRLLGTGEAGFLGVRLFGVLGAVLLTWLVARILLRTIPGQAAAVVSGTAFVALNPMLIVMSASVQNDTWSLVAGFAAVLVALGGPGARPWGRGLVLGALGAVAIMVKITVAPLVGGLLIVLLARRRWRESLAAAIVIAAGCTWWVLRNLALYGDLTGQAGVDAAGYRFQSGGTAPFALAREALTYLTLPDEYLRNVFAAPGWVDVLAVLVGAVLVVGAVALLTVARERARGVPLAVLLVTGVASVAAWLLQVGLGWHVAFRTAYGALPLAALAFGSATLWIRRRRGDWILCALLVLVLLVLCGWTGVQIAAVGDRVMLQL